MITRSRLALAALLFAVLTVVAPAMLAAQEHAPPATAAAASPEGKQAEAAAAHDAKAEHEAEGEAHDPGWMPTVWKAANFLILVGALTYFLRAPLMGYLNSRIAKVREDLVTAAQTRDTASRQLAEIDAKLKALPGDIEALKKRGAEDLVSERARIEQEAQVERERLLEHTRREIEMRLRIAKRELLELGAALAVDVAAERIKASITPEDQARLVDRYAAQLQTGAEARQ